MQKFNVLVAGAGLGGLTLAQSLRTAGIDVELFERDAGPLHRPQGYRLHLDADAIDAAHEVLPRHLAALFEATSMRTEPFTTVLTPALDIVKRIPTPDNHDAARWPGPKRTAAVHCNVDRATLRSIFISGLEDVCHYDKRLASYEFDIDGVRATFDDGSVACGNVLVGADGIRSTVRAARAPYAQTIDAGTQAIYGRIPLIDARRIAPDEVLRDIFSIATDERKVFLGLGPVIFPERPDLAGLRLTPPVSLPERDDYLVCIVGGRHERFAQTPETLRSATSSALQRIAIEMLSPWPERAAELVTAGDADSFFFVDMSTSVPTALDRPTNVVLLGDAIHAMTPTLGRGANLAMRDGALLGRALRAVACEGADLGETLAAYEADMLDYGFRVVRESVAIGQQRMAQNPLPAA